MYTYTIQIYSGTDSTIETSEGLVDS